jgi:hypothetical protein
MTKSNAWTAIFAVVGALSFAAPSHAAEPTGAYVAAASDAVAAPLYFPEPVVVAAPEVTYQEWLLTRLPHGVPIYNRPCTVSDGVKERGVPCETVAAALSGHLRRGVYPGDPVIMAYPGDVDVYVNGLPRAHHPHYRRHAHYVHGWAGHHGPHVIYGYGHGGVAARY